MTFLLSHTFLTLSCSSKKVCAVLLHLCDNLSGISLNGAGSLRFLSHIASMCVNCFLFSNEKIMFVFVYLIAHDQIPMNSLLDIKSAQVQLSKCDLSLLAYSDIDMSPESLADRLLHFLQGLAIIPRDSL